MPESAKTYVWLWSQAKPLNNILRQRLQANGDFTDIFLSLLQTAWSELTDDDIANVLENLRDLSQFLKVAWLGHIAISESIDAILDPEKDAWYPEYQAWISNIRSYIQLEHRRKKYELLRKFVRDSVTTKLSHEIVLNDFNVVQWLESLVQFFETSKATEVFSALKQFWLSPSSISPNYRNLYIEFKKWVISLLEQLPKDENFINFSGFSSFPEFSQLSFWLLLQDKDFTEWSPSYTFRDVILNPCLQQFPELPRQLESQDPEFYSNYMLSRRFFSEGIERAAIRSFVNFMSQSHQ